MIQDSIKILLSINGQNNYTMKYPQTVKLKIELSRSATYWGVFLNVVETFEAIKEDRQYILDYFEALKSAGYIKDYPLTIEVQTLNGDQYTTIYTGQVMPNYTDDTLRIKCKFNQNTTITEFLEGNRITQANFSTQSIQILLNTNKEIANTICGYQNITSSIYDNVAPFLLSPSNNGHASRDIKTSDTGILPVSTYEVFRVAPEENIPSITGDYETQAYQNKFIDSDSIIIPKRSVVNLGLEATGFLAYSIQETDFVKLPEFGRVKAAPLSTILSVNGSFSLQNDSPLSYWVITPGQTIAITNNSDTNANIRLVYERGAYSEDFDYALSYRNVSNASYKSYYQITFDNAITNAIRVKTLLSDFVYDLPSDTDNFLNDFVLIKERGTDNNTYEINVSNLLKDLSSLMSLGVSIDQNTNQLKIKRIVDMFNDNEVLNISEDNVFSLETSTNSTLEYSAVTLGASDRNYEYLDSDYDHTRSVKYKARNVFSKNFNLTPGEIKAQSNDLIDSFRDYLFNQNQEGKADNNYLLYNNTRLNSGNKNLISGNNCITPAFSFASWSWLFSVLSPTGFDLVDNNNLNKSLDAVISYNNSTSYSLGATVEGSSDILNAEPPKIGLRVIKAKIKLNTIQYEALIKDTEGYLTLNYRGLKYEGYLNNLALDIGADMLADVELLEKYK